MKLRQSFTDFIFATNTDGSGKAASYVRALDMLGPILTKHYPVKIINGSMWQNFTLPEVHGIYDWICAEMKKGAASPVLVDSKLPIVDAFVKEHLPKVSGVPVCWPLSTRM